MTFQNQKEDQFEASKDKRRWADIQKEPGYWEGFWSFTNAENMEKKNAGN